MHSTQPFHVGDYITHLMRATAWVRYNSRTGRASETQIARVMRQLSNDDLQRMLAERGVVICGDTAGREVAC